MSLIDLITGNTGNQVAEKAGNKFGIDKSQIIALLAVAAPLVISYLRKKSHDNPEEANKLNTALDKDHDGSILNNPEQAAERQDEGNSILSHIFGNEKPQIENQLSAKTGISMDKIGPILAMLAPIIMGFIGKEKQSNGVISGGGISDLLSGILGNASQQAENESTNPINDILGSVLGGGNSSADSGNPLSNILGGVLGEKNKQASQNDGILGGLLGGLFGEK
ncbi:DUF937 domain-containing protein [Halpernia sp.]|uniref:DUF937 domain-containing protein n=1 Tax=Halpernia sp. TaxID=2782209 RepID=UPI003A95CA20